MTDEPDIHPERAKLNALVAFCERRIERAGARVRAAMQEHEEAGRALLAAHCRLNAWIEANPDPQLELI